MFDGFQDIAHIPLLTIGDSVVTVGGLGAAIALTTLFMLGAWLIGNALKRVRMRLREGTGALYLFEKLLSYGLVLFGIFAGLSTLGLNLSSIAVFAGGLGIGLGLGLQGVVKEFVSGLVLIFDRAIHIGDYVEMQDGTRGIVQEIGPRATRIRNNDNVYLLVPNSKLIENTVINWTLKGETRRIHVPFQVAIGTDKEKVRAAVIEAARDVPFTLPDTDQHRTQVWLVGYGDSALNFELIVWPTLEAVKRPKAMNAAYTWAIDDALCKSGIEIPYPQRDIRLRAFFGEEGEDALQALNMERVQHAPSIPAPATINDAADEVSRPEAPEETQADDVEARRAER
ncbi:mechanosensitive ion channel family protein [Terricaulis silvestris]|uniref:Potassium efflux system KefA n=1 Tax=Terricaulis silvestris TaxID=2686094 RepID=A0A6I6MV26_9CAUL|nr:mechanosensitive ion channel domain-containing protein [Terricaulis silvestris]QGZ96294.1 Potassium efflux system KefA precursor [Terricaulis silvestris]